MRKDGPLRLRRSARGVYFVLELGRSGGVWRHLQPCQSLCGRCVPHELELCHGSGDVFGERSIRVRARAARLLSLSLTTHTRAVLHLEEARTLVVARLDP